MTQLLFNCGHWCVRALRAANSTAVPPAHCALRRRLHPGCLALHSAANERPESLPTCRLIWHRDTEDERRPVGLPPRPLPRRKSTARMPACSAQLRGGNERSPGTTSVRSSSTPKPCQGRDPNLRGQRANSPLQDCHRSRSHCVHQMRGRLASSSKPIGQMSAVHRRGVLTTSSVPTR